MIKNKKKILIIAILLLITLISGTFAWYTYQSNKSALVLTIGSIQDTEITINSYQVKDTMTPVYAYTSGVYSQVKVTNNITSNIKLYYKINELPTELINNGLRYTVTQSDTLNGTYSVVVSEGTFTSAIGNDAIEVLNVDLSTNEEKYYRVYLWLDANQWNQTGLQNKKLNLELNATYELLPAYAVYSEKDNSLRFYRSVTPITTGSTYNNLPVTNVYTGFETSTYSDTGTPWYEIREIVTAVYFEDMITPINTGYWFEDFQNASFFDVDNLNVEKTTKTYRMFRNAGYNVQDKFEIIGLNDWNTSNVTDIYYMFYQTGYNAEIFDIGDLSNWNTSKVISTAGAFESAGYNARTFDIGNLDNWDVSKLSTAHFMFALSGYNASYWNIGNISKWNTSNVINMQSMFRNAASNSEIFNIGDLSKWDTSNVTNMKDMFGYTATSATWSLNLRGWNVSKVTDHTTFANNVESKITEPNWTN